MNEIKKMNQTAVSVALCDRPVDVRVAGQNVALLELQTDMVCIFLTLQVFLRFIQKCQLTARCVPTSQPGMKKLFKKQGMEE